MASEEGQNASPIKRVGAGLKGNDNFGLQLQNASASNLGGMSGNINI